jgi:hypothetical protein
MKKFQNENSLYDYKELSIFFIKSIILSMLLTLFYLLIIMLFLTSCSQPAPPQEPTQSEIQDSVKFEVAEKKLNYILQSVKKDN